MLTLTQIELVQSTFAIIAPIADDAASLFYRRLFEIDPSLQEMFKGDMADQRRKLMQMLTAAVKGLPHLDRLVPVVEDLGRRHIGYGVSDEHYDTVGAALIWTLENGLGSAFTPEVKEAWITVYGILASTMKKCSRLKRAVDGRHVQRRHARGIQETFVGAVDCREQGVDLGSQLAIAPTSFLEECRTLVCCEVGECEKDRLRGVDGFSHSEPPPARGVPSARKSQARANVHSFFAVAGDRSRVDAVSSMLRPAK